MCHCRVITIILYIVLSKVWLHWRLIKSPNDLKKETAFPIWSLLTTTEILLLLLASLLLPPFQWTNVMHFQVYHWHPNLSWYQVLGSGMHLLLISFQCHPVRCTVVISKLLVCSSPFDVSISVDLDYCGRCKTVQCWPLATWKLTMRCCFTLSRVLACIFWEMNTIFKMWTDILIQVIYCLDVTCSVQRSCHEEMTAKVRRSRQYQTLRRWKKIRSRWFALRSSRFSPRVHPSTAKP